MNLKNRHKMLGRFAVVMAGIMVWDAVFPTVSLALTGGPSQPEFSSFEPVATTNMVNEFSGDFTYNIPIITIPGANGGGYAMSLSYHSGTSPEEEASWVGYGWTLNPGAINRSKRGYADDSKGDKIKFWNKTTANHTATLGIAGSLEAFSIGDAQFPGLANASIRYNNYKGFGLTAGAGMTFANGLVSLGYSVGDGNGSFSVKINPAALLSRQKAGLAKEIENSPAFMSAGEWQRENEARKYREGGIEKGKVKKGSGAASALAGVLGYAINSFGLSTHNYSVRNENVVKYSGASYNFTASVLPAFTPLPAGPTFDLFGKYSYQKNSENDELNTYGYMYSANAGKKDMMDYYMEKSNPYDKRDKYIGMPVNNADNYMVTGEGMGGGFRLHQKQAGDYRPNRVRSGISILNVGSEVEVGPFNVGGGADLGIGYQTLTIGSWKDSTINNGFASVTASNTNDEPVFFRFNNDAGGVVDYTSDALQQAKNLSPNNVNVPGFKNFDPYIGNISTQMNGGSRSSRSSFIAYHTNSEMNSKIYNGSDSMRYKSYTMNDDVNNFIKRGSVNDGVGELAVYNEEGARYTYGLPVYSRNEGSMQYDLDGVSGGAIDHNYQAYKNIGTNKSKIGEERPAPYATSYLLTEIVSPDYVDRTLNGPTDDDFGGYTRFSYKRLYGSFNKTTEDTTWYQWRIPYTGLLYNRGELSNPMDDMGSVNYGEKEIYYLDTVETKTHYAVFYTSDRDYDGLESGSNSNAATGRTIKGTKKLKKLDYIKVFSKGSTSPSNDKLIKTVRFEYYSSSTSMSQGVPNGNSTAGKLTLKRVWFEYDGIVPAKISPYVFEYQYSPANYPAKYDSIEAFDDNLSSAEQNPDYSPFILDAWGNYQEDSTRFDNMQSWVDQSPDATKFDPAAWQLKVIKLPTGGEIHVQYEQDDYSYVQDKPVEAFLSLKDTTGNEDNGKGKYYLNTADFGITSVADKNLLIAKINDLYVIPQKKMFFKFLYRLIGGASASLTDCASEYVKGYCSVERVERDANDNVYVILRESHGDCGSLNLPHRVCVDFVKSQRLGKLNTGGNCNADAVGVDYNSPKQVVLQLMNFMKANLIPGSSELCTSINYPLSYLKIPIPVLSSALKGKKGGGLRVKRLLLYDRGIESGDNALFGSEYDYRLPDGSSSGVATSEPSSIREESALIQFDSKEKSKFLCKLIAGRDREEHELPLGESVLPGPSVGYSRILVKNIHAGKTNTGFVIKEFYTAKEYPTMVEATTMDTKKDYLPIPGGLINYFTNNLWTTQGFRIKQNSMHGQPLSETTYAGDPFNMSKAVLSSQQVYDYYQPGERVPVMRSLNNITMEDLGKETEVTMESRKVSDVSLDLALEGDVSVGILFFPIPFLTGFPSFTYTESQLHTHATNKIINYPVIQKSVMSYADGIYHLSENIAFNPHTGKPVITRSTDGYNKLNLQLSSSHAGVYNEYKFPASQQYKDMGQKAKNERKIYAGNMTYNSSGGKYWISFTGGACPFSECSGDLVIIKNSSTGEGIFHTTDSIVGSKLYIYPVNAFGTPTISNGNSISTVEILRSGCTNQLNSTVGGFITYADTSSTLSSFNNVADREWLRDTLNSLRVLVAAMSPCSTATATLPQNKIKASLKVMIGGECYSLKDTADNGIALRCSSGNTKLVIVGVDSCDLGNIVEGCFVLDENHELFYTMGCSVNSCDGTIPGDKMSCWDLCPGVSDLQKINVVSANAQTFDDSWPYDDAVYTHVTNSNNYENGTKGKWRARSGYVYRDSIIGANAGNQRNYKNAGVFELQVFNWQDSSANDTTKWIKVSEITQYSPDGNALEEKDILNVYSTAKYGYSGTQPYLVAKNADYQSVAFDGFENAYNSNAKLEDGWALTGIATYRIPDTAHSGKYSWKLPASGDIQLKSMMLTQQMKDAGFTMKVWVRDTAVNNSVAVRADLTISSTHFIPDFAAVARTGEWTLYEMKMDPSYLSFAVGSSIQMHIINKYSSKSVWIDDVRVQPSDAQMITYVYDLSSQRLITTFDDQHFGLFYQYNAEGKLVRKMKETEKGMKTITETQYHTPSVAR